MKKSGAGGWGLGAREDVAQASIYQRIYAVVRTIPAGRVATYGGIARRVGGCTPRQVGYAMAALPARSNVPWHRVINSRGEISERKSGYGALEQRELLEEEGIVFDLHGKINLTEFGWRPSPQSPAPSP